MRRLLLLMCVLAVSLTASTKATPRLFTVFGCKTTEKVCFVGYNLGGSIIDFLRAAQEIKKFNIMLVIDGDCGSACAMVADVTRGSTNSCVTPRGTFHFHQARSEERVVVEGVEHYSVKYSIPPRTDPIDEWNQKKGGWPIVGYNRMPYPETLDYWKECPNVPLPRANLRRKAKTAAK